MSSAAARPIAEGLFVDAGGEVRLLGSQCGQCGVVTFPKQASCPRCTSLDVSDRLLSRQGTLWSWTIQCFPPKSPPYAVDDPQTRSSRSASATSSYLMRYGWRPA